MAAPAATVHGRPCTAAIPVSAIPSISPPTLPHAATSGNASGNVIGKNGEHPCHFLPLLPPNQSARSPANPLESRKRCQNNIKKRQKRQCSPHRSTLPPRRLCLSPQPTQVGFVAAGPQARFQSPAGPPTPSSPDSHPHPLTLDRRLDGRRSGGLMRGRQRQPHREAAALAGRALRRDRPPIASASSLTSASPSPAPSSRAPPAAAR